MCQLDEVDAPAFGIVRLHLDEGVGAVEALAAGPPTGLQTGMQQCTRRRPVARLEGSEERAHRAQAGRDGHAQEIVVPLALARHRKTMAQIEALGLAALQRAQLHRQHGFIGLRAHAAEHLAADAAALVRRVDIEMVQTQRVAQTLERHEADPPALGHDVLRAGRVEAGRQAFTRAPFVVAAELRQAVPHRAQPQGQQGLEIVGVRCLQRERGRSARAHPLTPAPGGFVRARPSR